jgi:ketohexokinase
VILEELRRYHIDSDYCLWAPCGKLPTSCITISRANGSRTIVHYRDLPEYDADAFARIPLERFERVHFEGRNVPQTLRMMRRVRERTPQLPMSLEVEKAREGIECLFPFADLLLFSKAYAARLELEPERLLARMRGLAPQADLVCSLGEEGALGIDRGGRLIEAPGCRVGRIKDTLGAGDTFNAGMLHMLQQGHELRDAMRFACALAGAKCGQSGLHGLAIPPVEG